MRIMYAMPIKLSMHRTFLSAVVLTPTPLLVAFLDFHWTELMLCAVIKSNISNFEVM